MISFLFFIQTGCETTKNAMKNHGKAINFQQNMLAILFFTI